MPRRLPHWDADTQEFWAGKVLLKHFERPATLVSEVLSTFEAKKWDRCIENPFKGQPDAKNQLRRAGKNLNHCQKVVQFSLTGDGMHIRWDWGKPNSAVPLRSHPGA